VRASPEKKEEKERVRGALLRATLRLSAAHGFASLGLREVAREAGIAPTSFYRHFADMEELGRALIEDSVAPLLVELETQLASAPAAGIDPELAVLDAAFAQVAAAPEVVRLVLSEQAGPFILFRRTLRQHLDRLAQVWHGVRPQTALGLSRAAVTVLLDGMNRALELPTEGDPQAKQVLHAEVLENLRILFAPDPRRTP
jgi:AcrR family transcriptional regulator